jgi:hypothetical protein
VEPSGTRPAGATNALNYMYLTTEEVLRMHGSVLNWDPDVDASAWWGSASLEPAPVILPCPSGVVAPEPETPEEAEEQALPCCFVCFHRDPSVAFFCGHVLCSQCYRTWYSQRLWKCWLCRKQVQGSLRLYFSSLDDAEDETSDQASDKTSDAAVSV